MGYDMSVRCATVAERDALLDFLAQHPLDPARWPGCDAVASECLGAYTPTKGRECALGIHVVTTAPPHFDFLVWLAQRSASSGPPGFYLDAERWALVHSGNAVTLPVRHVTIDANGRIQQPRPRSAVQRMGAALLGETQAARAARQRDLDALDEAWRKHLSASPAHVSASDLAGPGASRQRLV